MSSSSVCWKSIDLDWQIFSGQRTVEREAKTSRDCGCQMVRARAGANAGVDYAKPRNISHGVIFAVI